jgi:hypothetical protein
MKHQVLIRYIAAWLTLTAAAMCVHGQTLRTLGDLPSNSRTTRVSFQAQHDPWSTVPVSADDLEIFDGNTRITDFTMQYIPDSMPEKVLFVLEGGKPSLFTDALLRILQKSRCEVSIIGFIEDLPYVMLEYTSDITKLRTAITGRDFKSPRLLNPIFLSHKHSIIPHLLRNPGRTAIVYVATNNRLEDARPYPAIRRVLDSLSVKLYLVNNSDNDMFETVGLMTWPINYIYYIASKLEINTTAATFLLLRSHLGRSLLNWRSPALDQFSNTIRIRYRPTGQIVQYAGRLPISEVAIARQARHNYHSSVGDSIIEQFTISSRSAPFVIDSIASSNATFQVDLQPSAGIADTMHTFVVRGRKSSLPIDATLISVYFADTIATAVASFGLSDSSDIQLIEPNETSRHNTIPDSIRVATSIPTTILIEGLNETGSVTHFQGMSISNAVRSWSSPRLTEMVKFRASIIKDVASREFLFGKAHINYGAARYAYFDTSAQHVWYHTHPQNRTVVIDPFADTLCAILPFAPATGQSVCTRGSSNELVVADRTGVLRILDSRSFDERIQTSGKLPASDVTLSVSTDGTLIMHAAVLDARSGLYIITMFDNDLRLLFRDTTRSLDFYPLNEHRLLCTTPSSVFVKDPFNSQSVSSVFSVSTTDSIVRTVLTLDKSRAIVLWRSPSVNDLDAFDYFTKIIDLNSLQVSEDRTVATSVKRRDATMIQLKSISDSEFVVSVPYAILFYREAEHYPYHTLAHRTDRIRHLHVLPKSRLLIFTAYDTGPVFFSVQHMRFVHGGYNSVSYTDGAVFEKDTGLFEHSHGKLVFKPRFLDAPVSFTSSTRYIEKRGDFNRTSDTILLRDMQLGDVLDSTVAIYCADGLTSRTLKYLFSAQSLYSVSKWLLAGGPQQLNPGQCSHQRFLAFPYQSGVYSFSLDGGIGRPGPTLQFTVQSNGSPFLNSVVDFHSRLPRQDYDSTIVGGLVNHASITRHFRPLQVLQDSLLPFTVIEPAGEFTLQPGEFRNMTLRYNPKTIGRSVAHITAQLEDGTSTFNATALGDAGSHSFSLPVLDTLRPGCSTNASIPLNIVNTGTTHLHIDDIRVADPYSHLAVVAPSPVNMSIRPSDTLSLLVRMHPSLNRQEFLTLVFHSYQKHVDGFVLRVPVDVLQPGLHVSPERIAIHASRFDFVLDTSIVLATESILPDTITVSFSFGDSIRDTTIITSSQEQPVVVPIKVRSLGVGDMHDSIVVKRRGCNASFVVPIEHLPYSGRDTVSVRVSSHSLRLTDTVSVLATLSFQSDSVTLPSPFDSVTVSFNSNLIQPQDSTWRLRSTDSGPTTSLLLPSNQPVPFVSRRAAVCSTLITPSVPSLPPDVVFVGTAGLVVIEDLCAELDSAARPPKESPGEEVVRSGNLVTVRVQTSVSYRPSLVDVLGRTIYVPMVDMSSADVQQYVFNLDVLPPGVYFVLLVSDNEVRSFPLYR